MKRLRLTPLGNRITTTALSIGVGTSLVIYIWVVAIEGDTGARGSILLGGLIASLIALALGFYSAKLVTRRVNRIEDAARAVADGDFAVRIPVDSSGQLGQLARTFNEMQRRLAELDSARKQFIANASHELRTPIFSLGGFVELLEEEDPSPEEREEFVRTMRRQIERLTKLTADLLNLSQLDAGGIEMTLGSVDLSALAREVAREFGARAELHASRLELRTPDRPVIATADPERVRQVVRILLHRRLGRRLGARPGDRARAGAAHGRTHRDLLQPPLHRLHPRPAAGASRRPGAAAGGARQSAGLSRSLY